jgi:hypothetical protein
MPDHEGKPVMKTYLLSIFQPDGPVPPPEHLEPIMRALGQIGDEMAEAGALVFTGGLHPPGTATVVRAKDGDTLLTDGPYTEGKEFLGGLWIIQVPDLDDALAYGRKITAATTLPIEVRPFQR